MMCHLARSKEAVPACSVFGTQGPKVSLTRWLGWFDRYQHFESSWHSLLLALCVFGIYTGRWSSYIDMPIWGSGGIAGLPLEDASSVGGGGAEPSVAKDKPSDKYASAMELAARILGTRGKRDSARRIWRVCKPVVSAFGRQLAGMKGSKDTFAYYLGFAQGKYDWVLRKVWGVLQDAEALAYIGFSSCKLGGLAMSATTAACSSTDQEKASQTFRLAFALVKHRSLGRFGVAPSRHSAKGRDRHCSDRHDCSHRCCWNSEASGIRLSSPRCCARRRCAALVALGKVWARGSARGPGYATVLWYGVRWVVRPRAERLFARRASWLFAFRGPL